MCAVCASVRLCVCVCVCRAWMGKPGRRILGVGRRVVGLGLMILLCADHTRVCRIGGRRVR